MPALLSAALDAWIAERGDADQTFQFDPPPGKLVRLHGRLRQTFDADADEERHWGFRAIASTNAIAAQSRIKNACVATGFSASGGDKRQVFLLRNTPWPGGAKTTQVVADFEAGGGRTLTLSDDDLRTLSALRDLIDDDDAELPAWLVARKPAHGLAFLREALGEGAGPQPAEIPAPTTVPKSAPEPEPEPWSKRSTKYRPRSPASGTAVPLGVDDTSGDPLSVDLLALRKHTAIFAGSGSGKTVLIRRLVEECALRGVSSIVLDPNNDLARLGLPWTDTPVAGIPTTPRWRRTTWTTPRSSSGRPAAGGDDRCPSSRSPTSPASSTTPTSSTQPSNPPCRNGTACASVGQDPQGQPARAVLREALQWYGRRPSPTLNGFLAMLADLPDGVSIIANARDRPAS